MAGKLPYPHEVKPLTQEERALWKKYNTKDENEHIRVGPAGIMLTKYFLQHAAEIHNMPLRPTDIFVVTFPRSGTTWTQELVWLVANNFDFEQAKSKALIERFPFLEEYMFFGGIIANTPEEKKKTMPFLTPGPETLAKTPSPRFIKSHLPVSLLPAGTLETTKVVYVARDPRDVVVSGYHFFKAIPILGLIGDFKDYFDMFLQDVAVWAPFFGHVKEAWALKDHPNMLFLFYEELSEDLRGTAKRVARFLHKDCTEEQLDQLCYHLKFDNFQKNSAVQFDTNRGINILEGDVNSFIRKGKAGGWRDHFDADMTARAQRWMQDHLEDTDLRFQDL